MKNSTHNSTQPARVTLRTDEKSAAHSGVALHELVPGSRAALRSRVESGFLEDVDRGRAARVADAELPQLAEDAGVTPAVLVGNPQHEFADVLRGARAAGLAVGFLPLGLRFAGVGRSPLGECAGGDGGDEIVDRRPECRAESVEAGALAGGYGQLRGSLPRRIRFPAFRYSTICANCESEAEAKSANRGCNSLMAG
jgi:hypothetical protein